MEIVSLNTRGLNDTSKRKTLLNWFKARNSHVICLQETFIKENKVTEFNRDWDGVCIHSNTNSAHSRGVSILLKKNFDCEIINTHRGHDGRSLLINITCHSQTYTIVNAYAPNEENKRKNFFQNLSKWVKDHSLNNNAIIMCGDFNCSITSADRTNPNSDNSRLDFTRLLKYNDLNDTYRVLNPTKHGFTYSNKSATTQSRIDYILVSNYVLSRATKSYILTAPKCPDHKAVMLKVQAENKRGPGYWKLNTSYLLDDNYKTMIRQTIQKTVNETQSLNATLRWDYCKVRIKEMSIEYAILQSRIMKKEIQEYEKRLYDIDNNILNDAIKQKNETLITQLETERHTLKAKLDEYYSKKAMGNVIRSRLKYIEDGEKNTKFFFGLEKKRQTNNLINSVYNGKGKLVYDSNEILNEGKLFYEKLFKKRHIDDSDVDNFLDGINTNSYLSDVESNICEGMINDIECEDVVKNLSKNKSPGLDGLPGEFYTCFWSDIKDLVIQSFNDGFLNGKLAHSHRQIIISLIFKKNDRKKFKNYRPLSLSNVDYKILAFILAKRLQKVVHKLISPEQVAYINERYMGNNIRLLLDVIEHTEKENKSGVLLFLDFEKAFDSLSWNFIHKCLYKMGFGQDFRRWIEIIFNQPVAFLKINGFLSEAVQIERGIRQGCPISALIFIICTEFLAISVKDDDSISGIRLDDGIHDIYKEIKITQYADDTCIYLQNETYIEPLFRIIKKFSSCSGLNLNLDKTEGLLIGNLAENNPTYTKINWPKEPIRYLGIYIGFDHNLCYHLNWESKLEKMQKLIDCWRTRNLSIEGKILIIKSIIVPKIVFPATVLPIPVGIIKTVNKMFYNFLWGERDRIKRRILINKYCYGGLQMIDIETFFMALKASWLEKILNSKEIWSYIPKTLLTNLLTNELINMSFSSINDMPILEKLPIFYQQVVIGYCTARKTIKIETKSDLYNQMIWGNNAFMSRGKCLFNADFISSGYIYLHNVLNRDGTFKNDILGNISNKNMFLSTMYSIKDCLKRYKDIRYGNENELVIEDQQINRNIGKCNKKSKYYYKLMIEKKVMKNKMNEKWCTTLGIEVSCETFYNNKMKSIYDKKISSFNYKIFNDLLPTGKNLKKWQKSDTPECIYCRDQNHNLFHLLLECVHIENIWIYVKNILKINIDHSVVIFGTNDNDIANNTISLISYIIFKKYITDRNRASDVISVTKYIQLELAYYIPVYSSSKFDSLRLFSEKLCELKMMIST